MEIEKPNFHMSNRSSFPEMSVESDDNSPFYLCFQSATDTAEGGKKK